MKTLILPTDGSKNAEHAMRYAMALHSGQPTTFIIFQSLDLAAFGEEIPVAYDAISTEDIEENLKRNTLELVSTYRHEPFTFEFKSMLGGLGQCLDELASDRKADLIVMGTKGATGLVGAVIGSNAADVIANASCPVIAVPENAEVSIPKNILFATDNKGVSSTEIVAPMLEIARRSKAKLHLLHVLDEGHTINVEEAIAGIRLEHLLVDIEHDYAFLTNKDKALAIEQHVVNNAIDMLVTVPRRNNFFDAIFHRSVTRKLALHVKVPMLVMHDLG